MPVKRSWGAPKVEAKMPASTAVARVRAVAVDVGGADAGVLGRLDHRFDHERNRAVGPELAAGAIARVAEPDEGCLVAQPGSLSHGLHPLWLVAGELGRRRDVLRFVK